MLCEVTMSLFEAVYFKEYDEEFIAEWLDERYALRCDGYVGMESYGST